MDLYNSFPPQPHRPVTSFEFEARCGELLELVRRERRTLLIYRKGRPIAQISPYRRGRRTRGRTSDV